MTWDKFVIYMHELNMVSIFVRLFIAAIFGALLGMDRARKHRPAGFRTHMLVCLGSALVMITNQYLVESTGGGDPARLGAQVISGIGFLGAGTIILTRRNQVLGLTTAAGLWVDACIGLALGAGFYSGAIMAGAFILFTMVIMQGIDELLQKVSKYLQLYAEFESPSDLSRLLSFAANNRIEVNEVEMVQARDSEKNLAAMIHIKLPERVEHDIILEKLQSLDGIIFLTKL